MLLGDVVLAHGVCAAEAAEKGVPVETHAAHLSSTARSTCSATIMRPATRMPRRWSGRARALAALGIADPYAVTEVQT
jgi:probable rRNA maturation factor